MILERLNLMCDKCGAVSDFEHKSAAALHEEGERRGWAYDAHGNYCPGCAKGGNPEGRA